MEEISRLLPERMKEIIIHKIAGRWGQLEEIRLRLDKPIELNFHHGVEWIKRVIFNEKDSQYVLNQLSEHSLYRMEDELREGYITISGGHRVGLAGEVTTNLGKMERLKYITFFNIRIAKEIINIAVPFIPYLHDGKNYFNTIIVVPPQTGKTTIIRDIARLIGDGSAKLRNRKVAVIDERSEIAASKNGIPQHLVGLRTDVMDACPKVDGMMMMIRSMSPDVLIVDEIGKEDDANALMEAIYAGVTIICTIHGASLEEIRRKPTLQLLFQHNVFQRIIILKKVNISDIELKIYEPKGINIATYKVEKR